MKRTVLLFLVAVISLSLLACDNGKTPVNDRAAEFLLSFRELLDTLTATCRYISYICLPCSS